MKLLVYDIGWPRSLPAELVVDKRADLGMDVTEDPGPTIRDWLAGRFLLTPTGFRVREWELKPEFAWQTPSPGTSARHATQCVCPDTGLTGCFLFVGPSHRTPGSRVTPVYGCLTELFRAIRSAGWESVPWTCRHVLKTEPQPD